MSTPLSLPWRPAEVALFLLLLWSPTAAENLIEVIDRYPREEPTTSSRSSFDDRSGTIRSFSARISIDDLFTMPSISFSGNNDSAVFTKVKSALQRRSDGSEQIAWTGAIEGRIGFATIIRSPNGDLAASFTTDTTTYSLTTLADKSVIITETDWKDLPDEELDDDEEEDSNRRRVSEVLYPQKTVHDSGLDLSLTVSVPLDHSGERIISAGNASVFARSSDDRRLASHPMLRNNYDQAPEEAVRLPPFHLIPSERHTESVITITVMVVVANTAMCEVANQQPGCENTAENQAPMLQKMSILQEQTNDAFAGSDIANVEIQIVETRFLPPGYDGRADGAALDWVTNNAEVAQWRETAEADLVSFITGSGR
jgi:hypothetical protein